MIRPAVLLLVLVVLGFVFPASAQYSPGDVLVLPHDHTGYSQTRAYRLDAKGVLQTASRPLPTGFIGNAILAAPDNRSAYAIGQFSVLRITPDGSVTTPYAQGPTLQRLFSSADVDGSGALYLADGGTVLLRVFRVIGKSWSTLVNAVYGPYTSLQGVKARLDRNELVLLQDRASPQVYAVPIDNPSQVRHSGWLGLSNGSSTFHGWDVEDDPDTGQLFIGASAGGRVGVYRFDSVWSGPVPSLVMDTSSVGIVTGLVREPEAGTWVASTWNSTAGVQICRIDLRSQTVLGVLSAGPPPFSFYPALITVAGRRHVCGLGRPFPGGPYPFLVSFPGRPGAAYVAAASFGYRPAIPLGAGKRLHLAPDPLFFWSLTAGGPFQGFQGRLDAQGEARAALLVPKVATLSGQRFYVAAVTLKAGRIDRLSDPVGVSIQ